MKKTLSLIVLMSLTLCAVLTGCGDNGSAPKPDAPTATNAAPAAPSTNAP